MHQSQGSPGGDRRSRLNRDASLRDAWDSQADNWIAWAQTPMHDTYWRFHGEQFLDLIPPARQLTVDIGAGEGRLARELSARGHRVIAIDASLPLLTASRAADGGLPVIQADAARLPVASGAADLAVAFMSLQDIDDMPTAIREAGRVLGAGGNLIFAIVHPLNSAGSFTEKSPDSPFVIAGTYLDSFRYEDHVERDGLEMSFVSDHRPLEAYFAALTDSGFLVEELREPRVPENAIGAPAERRWQRVPLFLHARAVKP